jgi:DNA-binding response OmpR family regulator
MRILLIEGDHRLATSLRRALGEWGMTVDLAHDGEEGLARGTTGDYEVLVVDATLPLRSGEEVARELRDRRVHTPILMLTALDTIEGYGLDSGTDDFLVKPFAQRELVARIRGLGRQTPLERRPRLRVGDIILDSAARTVRVGEVTVELTGREFSVLEYLMLHRGRVLSKAQILEHIWQYDFEGGRNMVEVYVGRVRRKLVDAGAADPIVTVRGAGYRYDFRD